MPTKYYDITAIYTDGGMWQMTAADLSEAQIKDMIQVFGSHKVMTIRNPNGVFMLDTRHVRAMKIVPTRELGIST